MSKRCLDLENLFSVGITIEKTVFPYRIYVSYNENYKFKTHSKYSTWDRFLGKSLHLYNRNIIVTFLIYRHLHVSNWTWSVLVEHPDNQLFHLSRIRWNKSISTWINWLCYECSWMQFDALTISIIHSRYLKYSIYKWKTESDIAIWSLSAFTWRQ